MEMTPLPNIWMTSTIIHSPGTATKMLWLPLLTFTAMPWFDHLALNVEATDSSLHLNTSSQKKNVPKSHVIYTTDYIPQYIYIYIVDIHLIYHDIVND